MEGLTNLHQKIQTTSEKLQRLPDTCFNDTLYNIVERTLMQKRFLYSFIFITSLLFLLRVIFFAGNFGAVEHDSGWFLGVARNLAQRGIYASYTNTVKDEGFGEHPSIHGRYSVQDGEGFSYFPAGVTAGPGYVIPEAAVLKLFGFGFWQLRAWPLVAFLGVLILLFLFTYRLGGYVSLLILQAWMWVVPQLYITFSYEAYGEHIALFYLLISFHFLYKGLKHKGKGLTLYVSGIFYSLAVLTKYLIFLVAPGFLVIFLVDFYSSKKAGKKFFANWISFVLGAAIPIGVFEVFRYVYLVSIFGQNAWKATNMDFLLHFKSNGSSISLENIDWGFVSRKLTVWTKVGISYYFVPWIILILSPLTLIRKKIKAGKIFYLLLLISSLGLLGWYVLFSPTGWSRHAWFGLVIAIAVISVNLGNFFYLKKEVGYLVRTILIVLLGTVVITTSGFYPKFFLGKDEIADWRVKRYEGGIQGLPHTDIFSLSDQKELINYFRQNVKSQDRVYYLGWFLVAEASPLTDKVFYSLDRYLSVGQTNPDGGKSYLIIGPYQKGKYSIVPSTYYPDKVLQLCKRVVFENPSYTLCILKNNLVYENRAYD